MDEIPTDEPIRIARHVRRELGSRVRDFEIVVDADGLILRGRTTSYYAKQLVQHIVMRVARCRVAANEIDVA
jgi:hypothetical protein